MEILLDELYKIDLTCNHYVERKLQLDEQSYQISGIAPVSYTHLTLPTILRV